MVKSDKVPVSERALVQRVNRMLAQEDQALKKTRGSRWLNDLGAYYTADLQHNAILDRMVDLEEFGKEFGMLAEYEHLDLPDRSVRV